MDETIYSLTGEGYTEKEKREMWIDIHYRAMCPLCGAKDSMLKGPRGGLAMNIKCYVCHVLFWVTPYSFAGAYPVGRHDD